MSRNMILLLSLLLAPFVVAQDDSTCLKNEKEYRTDKFDADDFLADDQGIVVANDLVLDTQELDLDNLVLGLEQPFYVDYLSEGAGASHLFGFFFFDIDTDKDGFPDFFETGDTDDLDGDGLANNVDDDDDGDGILDVNDTEPSGVNSMPASYFRNGTIAANNSISGKSGTPDFWQFVPNSKITEGTYEKYYEMPGTYLYIDNNANEIPDVLEYNRGNNKTPPYVTDKGYKAEHKTQSGVTFGYPSSNLGLLGNDWTYEGTPGTTTSDKYHWTGSTIFYIADDDGGTWQTGEYENSPYWPAHKDIFNNTDAAPDYLIYGTTDPDDSRIPDVLVTEDEDGKRQFVTDSRGQEMYKYRWYQSSVSGAREMVFFLIVFYSSGSAQVQTYYSKSAFNPDDAPWNPGRNGNTTGDQYGYNGTTLTGGEASNWYPSLRVVSEHNALVKSVWGVDNWTDIASWPSSIYDSPVLNTGAALKNAAATQDWVDEWENFSHNSRVLQYRALADWFSATPVDANDVINGRYTIDMSAEGDSSVIRAANGSMVHLMVGAPRATRDAWLLGWEDLFGGGDRDYEDVVFYVKRQAGGELVSLNVADDIGVGAASDAEYSLSQVSFSFEDNFLDEYWGTEGRYIAYFYRLSQTDEWIPLLGDDSGNNLHHERTVDKFQAEYGGSTVLLADGETVRRTVTIPVEEKKTELFWKVQMASENVDASFQPKVTAATVGYQSLVHDFYYNSAVIPNSNINYIASHETPSYDWSEVRNRGHLYAFQTFVHGTPPVLTELDDDDSPEKTPTSQPVAMWQEDVDSEAINLFKWDAGVSLMEIVEDGNEERTIYTYEVDNNSQLASAGDRVTLDRDGNDLTDEIIEQFDFSNDKTTANVWVDNYHQPSADTRDERAAAIWLINWIHGNENPVISQDGVESSPETREWVLGGINRASPMVVRAPGRPQWFDNGKSIPVSIRRSYLEFIEEQKSLPTRVIIGSDSGLIHCFDAGTWVGESKVDEKGVELDWAEGHYKDDNYGDGKEVWAMLPGHLLPDIKYNYTGANDVVAKSDATGVTTVIYQDNKWKRIAVFVQGYKGGTQDPSGASRVGNVVWAMDITDPDDPMPLWQRSDSNMQDLINPVTLGWVKFGDSLYWAVCYPSGGTEVTGEKPAFRLVNAYTGAPIANQTVGSDAGMGLNTMLGTPAMMDTNGDGYVDHLFGATSEGILFAFNTETQTLVQENIGSKSFYLAPNVDLDDDGNVTVVAVSSDSPLIYDHPDSDFTNVIYHYTYNVAEATWTEIETYDLPKNHKAFSRPKLIGSQLVVGTTTGDTFNFCDADVDDPGRLLLYDLDKGELEDEIEIGPILAPIVVSDGRVLVMESTSVIGKPNIQGSVWRNTKLPDAKEIPRSVIGEVFGVASWQDELIRSLLAK